MLETTADEFRDFRRDVGLRTRRQAAAFFGVAEHTIYRWEAGRSTIPDHATRMLKLRADLRKSESALARLRRSSSKGIEALIRSAVRSMREEQGLTQDRLARRAHVSRSWLAHFEQHRMVPTTEPFAAVLTALNFDASEILSDIPGMGKTLRALSSDSYRLLLALLVASHYVNLPSAGSTGSGGQRSLF